jgi:hypothetical protein
MGNYVALHDRRLRGGVPARPSLTIVNTDGHTPLHNAFSGINAAARSRGEIDTLFILCHGYAGENTRAQMCMDAGGMGLQLGREDVLHGNVAMWRAIAGRVSNIVVYACAAANTERGNEFTTADGRYLMGALALHANAFVYAADRIQWYSTFNDGSHGRFDFGAWEGTVYQFPPMGGQPIPIEGAPVELADIFRNKAS